MPRYIVPVSLTGYLSRYVKDLAYLERIAEHLKEFITRPEQSREVLKKKQFGRSEVYTIDVNIGGYHRAVFRRIVFEGKSCLMLSGFAWAHNYRTALTSAIKEPTRETLHQFYGGEIEFHDNSLEDDALIMPEAMIFYREHWYQPTALQSAVLQERRFPQLLIGPPGSGKTLIAMGLLQEQALTHYQERRHEVLKLLYITGNASLVQNAKKSWSEWEKEHLPSNYTKVVVVFLTVQEYLHWYSESVGKHLITEPEFVAELKKLLPKEDAPMMLQELYHNAWMLELDRSEQKAYAQSLYKHTGDRHSVYSLAQREEKYPHLIDALQILDKKSYFFPGVTSFTNGEEDYLYDLAIMDESQKEMLQSLLGVLRGTKNNQMLFIGDSFQKGALLFSPLERLKGAINALFRQELHTHRLANTHRLQPDVARLAHELVLLYSNLKGGKADATSYTSIEIQEKEDASRSVYLLQKNMEQCAHLGSDAATAAVVLSSEDVDEARELIQGNNVFTHNEAQGLEFQRVFLYLSSKTLHQFSAVAELMSNQGITFESVLKERPHLVADKTHTDGVAQELLSHLFIAISRTCGELLVCWDAEKQPAHQLKPFLAWFSRRLNAAQPEAAACIKNHISTRQEWLDAIHRFIDEGAVSQARANLQKVFQLNDSEVTVYLGECQKKGQKSLSDFEAWVQQLPQRTALKLAAPKKPQLPPSLVAELEARYAMITQEEQTKWALHHDKAQSIWFTYPFKEEQCLWVNLFFEGRLAPVLNYFKNERDTKQKNKYSRFIKSALDAALRTQDILLLMCLRTCVADFVAAFPNMKYAFLGGNDWFSHEQMLSVLQSVTMAQRHRLLQINWVIKDKSKYTVQYKEEQGGFGLSMLHLLLLDSKKSKDVYQTCHKMIIENLGLCSTQPGVHQNYTILRCVMESQGGFEYLIKHFSNVISNLFASQQISLLFDPMMEKQGGNIGSFFYVLCRDPNGIELLRTHWSYFEPLLQENSHALFDQVTIDCLNQGASPFYALCENSKGRTLIVSHWDVFKGALEDNPQALFKQLTGAGVYEGTSPFYYLCATPEGRSLIVNKWDIFEPILEKNIPELFKQKTGNSHLQGASPFYFLCANPEGLFLIKNNWEWFHEALKLDLQVLFAPVTGEGAHQGMTPFYHLCEDQILIDEHWIVFQGALERNPQALFAPVTGTGVKQGTSPFYHLCANSKGRALIEEHWEWFQGALQDNSKALFKQLTGAGVFEGASPFYFLCANLKGRALIEEHWEWFQEALERDLQALFAPVTGAGVHQGTSPFYYLCAAPEGQSLIKNNWEWFHEALERDLQALFAPVTGARAHQGASPLYHLCASIKGRALIEEHWEWFQEALQDNSKALFAPITGAGVYEGTSPFYFLCANPEGLFLIKNNWEWFHEALKRDPQALFAPITGAGVHQGTSPFYYLCGIPEGRNLIAAKWDIFEPILEKNIPELFKQRTGNNHLQGTSPFFILCSSLEGRAMIEQHWNFFEKIIGQNHQSLFISANVTEIGAGQGESPFYFLCSSLDGCSMIQKYWDVFGKIIKNNSQHLFALVPENDVLYKGKNMLHLLSVHHVLEHILTDLWPYIHHNISLEDLSTYPNGAILVEKIKEHTSNTALGSCGLFSIPQTVSGEQLNDTEKTNKSDSFSF